LLALHKSKVRQSLLARKSLEGDRADTGECEGDP